MMVTSERVEFLAGGTRYVGHLRTPLDGRRGVLVVLGPSGSADDHGERLAAAGYVTLTLAPGGPNTRRAAIDFLRSRDRTAGDIGVLDLTATSGGETAPQPAHPDATSW